MARAAAKPKKEISMEEALWKSADNLQFDLAVILDEYGYPPVTIDDVYKEVLEQAENFKKYAS